MRENGNTIKLKAMEFIPTQIMLNMKENGIKIYNMEKVLKSGRTDQYSLVNIEMEKRMVWESTNGETGHAMKVSGKTMK